MSATATRIPTWVQVVAGAGYGAYWLVIAGSIPPLGATVTLSLWLVSSALLIPCVGLRRGVLVVAGCAGVFVLAAFSWGNAGRRFPDAEAAALYAWTNNYEPDAGPVATCSPRTKFALPVRVTYDCRAGFCRHRRPVYVIRVRVTHSAMPGRWTFVRTGRGPVVHGSVDPRSVNPVDCSALGPGA
jgi:hypothetical protein